MLSNMRFLCTLQRTLQLSDIPSVSPFYRCISRSGTPTIPSSKGAAIALLDAVYLPLHLPSDVAVRYVGYASPRVRNPCWLDILCSGMLKYTPFRSETRPSQTTSTRNRGPSRASTTRRTPSRSCRPSTSSATTTPAAKSTSATTTCGSPVPVCLQAASLGMRRADLMCSVLSRPGQPERAVQCRGGEPPELEREPAPGAVRWGDDRRVLSDLAHVAVLGRRLVGGGDSGLCSRMHQIGGALSLGYNRSMSGQ